MLKFERQVREQIEKLREQLNETRQHLRLTPNNIEAVVRIGLELAEQPGLIEANLEEVTGKAFYLPPLKSSWAACSEGLAHPHTKVIRPIVFDPELSHGRDDVVLAHLNHRLVQMCLRLLRAEVWSKEGKKSLNRVTARLVPNSVLETPAVIAYGRLVILGSDQQRLHEEVITAGGLLKEGKFNRMGVMQIQSALSAVLPNLAPEKIRKTLESLWNSHGDLLMQSLQVRMQDRAKSLQRDLSNRAEKEAADITAILTELQRSIEQELNQPEIKQLELFNNTEKEQFERNVNSLKARLAQIPAEVEREVAAVKARFTNPTPRLFPLAVIYLVPQKLAK
jgi:molecular chaperone DnaK (HSP70)